MEFPNYFRARVCGVHPNYIGIILDSNTQISIESSKPLDMRKDIEVKKDELILIEELSPSNQKVLNINTPSGRVFIGDRLSKGSFGVVHFGLNVDTGERLAIKYMRSGIDSLQLMNDSPMILDRVIKRELDIYTKLKKFNHPHIAEVRDMYQIRDHCGLIIMKYYSKSMEDVEEITKDKAIKYSLQIAEAIKFLQENKIVHRDLKPNNLLIDDGDNIRLIDFGLAAYGSEFGLDPAGSNKYIAPEAITKRNICKSDIWSLGAMMFEMMTGEDIPKSSSLTNNLQIKKRLVDIARSKIGDPIGELISKMLEPNPGNRIGIKSIIESLRNY